MDPLVQTHTNKRVTFTFAGDKLQFDLSHGLFSSFDVDAGTKLLLKTVAQRVELRGVRSIVDIGCGTGVIGVCLMKKLKDSLCVMQDRDALALRFAKSNSTLNGVESSIECAGGLGFQELNGRSFDLIVSNIPAKAGVPVLNSILRDMLAHLTTEGLAAIVVVMPLAEAIDGILDGLGVQILHREETREHRVYHFKPTGGATVSALSTSVIEPYIRNRGEFRHGKITYQLETVYNLPDFDTLGRKVVLALDLLDKRLTSGSVAGSEGEVVVWNPGQGHLPAYLVAGSGRMAPLRITIASRDALQLEVTARNLPSRISTHHIPSLELLSESIAPESVSLFVLFPEPVSGVNWQKTAATVVPPLLKPGGFLLASASSTHIHRLLEALRGMVLHGNKKYRGGRAVLLKKSS